MLSQMKRSRDDVFRRSVVVDLPSKVLERLIVALVELIARGVSEESRRAIAQAEIVELRGQNGQHLLYHWIDSRAAERQHVHLLDGAPAGCVGENAVARIGRQNRAIQTGLLVLKEGLIIAEKEQLVTL